MRVDYSVVLNSAAQRSDSVMRTQAFFLICSCIMGYHGMWNAVPWAAQQDPVVLPFCL